MSKRCHPKISLWSKIEKTKGTLFSQTLKFEEIKVPLVFSIIDQGLRYGHFMNLHVFPLDITYWKIGYLAAALPADFKKENFKWCFYNQKRMGLALLLIDSNNFGIMDLPHI